MRTFCVCFKNHTLIVDSIAPSGDEAWIRFFKVDGMGKYMNMGIFKAVEDGYYLVEVEVKKVRDAVITFQEEELVV